MKKSHGFASPTSIVWCVSRVISQFSAHMPAPSTCMYSCYQMSRESHKSRSVGHLWNIPPYPSLWGNLLRYGCTAVHPHILCDPEWLLPLSISIFETFINQSFYFPEAKIVAASLYLLFQSHTVSLLSPSVYEPSAVARQPVNSEEKVEELLDEILLLLFLSPPPLKEGKWGTRRAFHVPTLLRPVRRHRDICDGRQILPSRQQINVKPRRWWSSI